MASLDALEQNGLWPAVVVTRPDAPVGRKKVLTPPPVKEWAQERGIDVLQPTKIDDAFITELGNTQWDVFVVVAYGKILPTALLDIPRRGTLNMHPSLLPHLRGPHPIRGAILQDERETGVTVMQLDAQMDHGPIVAQARVELDEWPMSAPLLEGILAKEGGELLAEALPLWVSGEIDAREQEHESATYCTKTEKHDAEITLADDAYQNLLKIRAYAGWPGAYTFFERGGKRIRVEIIDAHVNESGELVLDIVKPEGKNEMPYADFARSGAEPIT